MAPKISNILGTVNGMGKLSGGSIGPWTKYVSLLVLEAKIGALAQRGQDGKAGTVHLRPPIGLSGLMHLVQLGLVLLAMVFYVATVSTASTDARNDSQGIASWQAAGNPFGPSAFLSEIPSTSQSLGHSLARPHFLPAKERVSAFPAMVRAADRSAVTSLARIILGEWYQLLDLQRCALLFPFHWFW